MLILPYAYFSLYVLPHSYTTMFYRAKNTLNRGVRIKLDLTKSRYDLLNRVNDHVIEVASIKVCYTELKHCLKVKFNDEKQRGIFFSSFDDLRDIADMELFYFLSLCL